MTPAVVWDMGGIMYRYFTEMIVDVGLARGWPIDEIPLGPTHTVPDPAYDAMERGEITEPDYLDAVVRALASHGISYDPLADLDWSHQLRPSTWEAVSRLHELGYRQGLLTNDASRWLGDGWWQTWEAAECFTAVIDVTMVGIRKPAPEPYLAAAVAMGLDPADCLFVDDMHCNCVGAETVGMDALWFDITDPAGSIDRLYLRLGIDIGA